MSPYFAILLSLPKSVTGDLDKLNSIMDKVILVKHLIIKIWNLGKLILESLTQLNSVFPLPW